MSWTGGRTQLLLTAICSLSLPAVAAERRERSHLITLPENVQTTEAALAAAREAGGEYKVHLTNHYAIVYAGPIEIARARGRLLEECYEAFFTFMRHMGFDDLTVPPYKMTVIVFDDERPFLAYRHQEELASADDPSLVLSGYYSPETNRAVLVNQKQGAAYLQTMARFERLAGSLQENAGPPEGEIVAAAPEGERVMTKQQAARELQALADELQQRFAEANGQVTQHEGAHQLAFNTGVRVRGAPYPVWASEGLACLFEMPSTDTMFGTYRVNEPRLADYRRLRDEGRLADLRRLIAADDVSADRLREVCAESWSLVYFLLKRKPKELRAYLHDLSQRPVLAASEPGGVSYDEPATFACGFGDDLDEIELEWRRFVDALIAPSE